MCENPTLCSPCKVAANLKASPLRLAPLTAAGFLAASLFALQYSHRLDGLFGFCSLVVVLLYVSPGMCAGSLASGCWFPGIFF